MASILTTQRAPGEIVLLVREDGGSEAFNPGGAPPGAPGITTSFVYQPGGTTHDNVFGGPPAVAWPALVAAVNGVAGLTTVLIDPTFAGDLGPTVPAGAWKLNDVLFYGHIPTSGFVTTLTFEDGAHLTPAPTALYFENLLVANAGNTPTITYAGGNGCGFILFEAGLLGGPGAPLIKVATDSGSTNFVALGVSEYGDGTNPFLETDGAGNVFLVALEGVILFAHGLSGTGNVNLSFSSGATIQTPQDVTTVTSTQLGLAVNMNYTATTVANWSGTNPTSVANALDRIAAKITPIP